MSVWRGEGGGVGLREGQSGIICPSPVMTCNMTQHKSEINLIICEITPKGFNQGRPKIAY